MKKRKYKKCIDTKSRGFKYVLKHLLQREMMFYWIKTLRKCQDFQVENITMGHPICLYIFYISFYFNTDFWTLIIIIVRIIIITRWRKTNKNVSMNMCFSVNWYVFLLFFFHTCETEEQCTLKIFFILFHSQHLEVRCKWQIQIPLNHMHVHKKYKNRLTLIHKSV